MLVKELKKLLANVPGEYKLSFAIEVSDGVPTLIEIANEDIYINHANGHVEIDTEIAEEARQELEDIIEKSEMGLHLKDDGIFVYTKEPYSPFKTNKQKAIDLGIHIVRN